MSGCGPISVVRLPKMLASNQVVGGSSPSGRANVSKAVSLRTAGLGADGVATAAAMASELLPNFSLAP